MVTILCKNCGKSFNVRPIDVKKGAKYCSRTCYLEAVRKSPKPFHLRKFKRSDGYMSVWDGDKYVLEHRKIIENHLGRTLTSKEQVHHINKDRSDNRLENFQLMLINDHSSLHHPGRDNSTWITVNCLYCGKEFDRRIKEHNRHPHPFCSRDCYIKGTHLIPRRNRHGGETA